MNLNLKNILKRTNRGFDVYQYILNEYYPGINLERDGDICLPVKNPFNADHKGLVIEIRDLTAGHWDLHKKSFWGDMLDFAQQHFKTQTRPQLYFMINQALQLGLIAKPLELGGSSTTDPSWWPKVSYFLPPISNTKPSESLSLDRICDKIDGGDFYEITKKLRAITDPKKAQAYKAANFPYVTFGGTFSSRNEKGLIKNSELVVFDFDDLEDLETAKYLLLEDDYFDTELMFTSPSGNGLKWVIRHKAEITPDRSKFFQAVSNYLKSEYGLTADKSGSDWSRACYLANDIGAFLNTRHFDPWRKEEEENSNEEIPNSN